MATATLNISLPDKMKATIEEVVQKEGYGNTSEFFRDLVRNYLKERRQRELEEALLEGLASGEPVEYSTKAMEELTRNVIDRVQSRPKR